MAKTFVFASAFFLGAAAFGVAGETALAAEAKSVDAMKKACEREATLKLYTGKQRSRFIRQCLAGIRPARPRGNADGHAANQSAQYLQGRHRSQQCAGRAERAGDRLYRHINHRVECYVHKRFERHEHWKLQTIDTKCPLSNIGTGKCGATNNFGPRSNYGT